MGRIGGRCALCDCLSPLVKVNHSILVHNLELNSSAVQALLLPNALGPFMSVLWWLTEATVGCPWFLVIDSFPACQSTSLKLLDPSSLSLSLLQGMTAPSPSHDLPRWRRAQFWG